MTAEPQPEGPCITSAVALATFDATGAVIDTNAALQRLLQRSAQELRSQPLGRFMSPAGRVMFENHLLPRLHLAGQVDELALQLRDKQGGDVYVLCSAARIEEAGQVRHECAFMRMSARKRTEDELLRLKLMTEQVPGALFQLLHRVDGSLHLALATPAVRVLFGLQEQAGAAAADALFTQVAAEDMQPLRASLHACAQALAPWRAEFRVRLGGQLAWRAVEAHPQPLDGGAVLWHGYASDITSRKGAEAMFAAQQRLTRYQLHLSERLHDVTDAGEMVKAATAALGAHLGVAQVGFGEIDAAQTHVTVHGDWNDGRIASVVGTWRMDAFGRSLKRSMRAGQAVVISDVELDARTSAPEVLAAYAAIGARSLLDCGLSRDGRLVAMILVHHPSPRAWTAQDVALAEHTCERLWSAMERARAEDALRIAAVAFEAQEGMAITDAQGRVLRVNQALCDLTGHDAQDLLGRAVATLLCAGDRNPDLQQLLQEQVSPNGCWQGEAWVGRQNGTAFQAQLVVSAVRGSAGAPSHYVVSLADISQRKRAENAVLQSQTQLSRLTQRLMEQERNTTEHLAQVLHDGLGQTLTALVMRLDAMAAGNALAQLPQALQPHAAAARELSAQAQRGVRSALVELRPPMLHEQGLVAALANQLQWWRRQPGSVALTLAAAPALRALRWPPQVEYAFYMVAREAFNNALRHAAASRIECLLEGAASWLRLQLRDDGCGVSDDPQRPGHLGVVGMRERAFAINAHFTLQGRPGKGTLVEMEWEQDDDEPDLLG